MPKQTMEELLKAANLTKFEIKQAVHQFKENGVNVDLLKFLGGEAFEKTVNKSLNK